MSGLRSQEITGRMRAKAGCCRGCDRKWGTAEGQCRYCSACLKCCGNEHVHNSCECKIATKRTQGKSMTAGQETARWKLLDRSRS